MKKKPQSRSTCSCEKCKSACKVKPGIFKYEQIGEVADYLNIDIKTLFNKYLGIEYVAYKGINTFVLAPATLDMKPGGFYNVCNSGICIFLDENSNCKIHPVAPFECQHYIHSKQTNEIVFTRKELYRNWRNKTGFINGLYSLQNKGFFPNLTLIDMKNDAEQIEKLKVDLNNKSITPDKVLEQLESLGFAPCLMSDDNGHWALTSDGFQNVPKDENPADISITAFVEAKNWKKTIREAILIYLDEF